jgi:hypothetical protein
VFAACGSLCASFLMDRADDPSACTDIVLYNPAASAMRPVCVEHMPDAPSVASGRGRGFLFTVAAPADAMPSESDRRLHNCLLPSDIGRQGAVDLLKGAFGPANNLRAAVAVIELHQRRAPCLDGDMPGTGFHPRLQHLHVAGLVTNIFAHKKMANRIQAMAGGLRGHFSIGDFESKVLYLTEPSASKCRDDLDIAPFFWGDVRPGDFEVDGHEPPKKRLKACSVNDLTAAMLDNRLLSVASVKAYAKSQFLSGTEFGLKFYRYILSLPGLDAKVNEILELFHLRKTEVSLYNIGDTFPLSSFEWCDPRISEWIASTHQKRTLVLSGMSGAGKSRFALAATLAVAGGPVLFARSFEEVRDAQQQGWQALVLDEVASLLELWVSTKRIDAIKNVLDVELSSSWPCRQIDARVPAGQPRVVIVQRRLDDIVKPFVNAMDWEAIERRFVGVHVVAPLKKESHGQSEH